MKISLDKKCFSCCLTAFTLTLFCFQFAHAQVSANALGVVTDSVEGNSEIRINGEYSSAVDDLDPNLSSSLSDTARCLARAEADAIEACQINALNFSTEQELPAEVDADEDGILECWYELIFTIDLENYPYTVNVKTEDDKEVCQVKAEFSCSYQYIRRCSYGYFEVYNNTPGSNPTTLLGEDLNPKEPEHLNPEQFEPELPHHLATFQ